VQKAARKSIVAKINIRKGVVITRGMLAIKRPGTGLAPKYINQIVGKIARKDIRRETLISWDIIE